MASNQQRQPTFDDPGVDDPRALSERQQWLGWLTNLIDGAMLGWGDEATAGILSMMPGSPGYTAERDQFRRYQDRYNEQNPIKGGVTNLAGNLVAGGALPKVAMTEGPLAMALRGLAVNVPAGAAGMYGGARESDFGDPGTQRPAINQGSRSAEVLPAFISGFSPRFGGTMMAGSGARALQDAPGRPNMVSSSVHGRPTPPGKRPRRKRTEYTDEELELMYNPQAYPLKRYGEKKKKGK